MRTLISIVLFTAISLAVTAQESQFTQSPEALFTRGLNALRGSGPSRNVLNAVADIRTAAEAGHVPAQTALGYLYENGSIVTRDQSEAARWYKKAAEAGDPIGQYAIGRSRLLGLGISTDTNEAQHWLRLAADQESPYANYLLGKIFEDRGDYASAVGAYRAAAELGIPFAQYRLALLLKDGRGRVPIDRAEAYVWLLLSSEARIPGANITMQELESALGSTQTEAAKTKARELRRSVSRSINAKGCTGWRGESDEYPTIPPPEIQPYCR